MKNILTFLSILTFSVSLSAQIFSNKSSQVSFMSESLVEDISAINKTSKFFLNTETNAIQGRIKMRDFTFAKPLMQEHFNETYVESEKYPYAILKGTINEVIDYTIDGKHDVTVTGSFSIHGVEQERTVAGTLEINKGEITIASTFNVVFEDHEIDIPALQKTVIPDDTEVKINAVLVPYKKK